MTWPFRVTWRHWSHHRSISRRPFPIDGSFEPNLCLCRFKDIQWRMWHNGWHHLKRPLCKGQGHSFWYQSIPHMRLPIGCQMSIVTFALGRAVTPQHICYRQTTYGRNIHCVQKKNIHSHFLSYLYELFVDCTEYTQGLIDSENVKIRYSLQSMT